MLDKVSFLSTTVLIATLLLVGCSDTNEQEAHLQKICQDESCEKLTLLNNVCYDTRQAVIAYEAEHLNTIKQGKETFEKQKFSLVVDKHITCLELELKNTDHFQSSKRSIISDELNFAKSRKSAPVEM